MLVELKVGFAEKIANKVHSRMYVLSADLGFEEKIADMVVRLRYFPRTA